MADIFISYAKPDRDLALKLSAYLEAQGWSTWWDTSLLSGDDFRDVIMSELIKARAVIVIWTDNSVKSDWVRSEAGRAQADNKLIPVKLPYLAYRDVPPPFDVLHTENIRETEKIHTAVVAQIARPAVELATSTRFVKLFRHHLFSHLGVVGGAFTLFTGLQSILIMSDWARWFISNWIILMQKFWKALFDFLGLSVPPVYAPTFTFLGFCMCASVGYRMSASWSKRPPFELSISRLKDATLTLLATTSTAFILSYNIFERGNQYYFPVVAFPLMIMIAPLVSSRKILRCIQYPIIIVVGFYLSSYAVEKFGGSNDLRSDIMFWIWMFNALITVALGAWGGLYAGAIMFVLWLVWRRFFNEAAYFVLMGITMWLLLVLPIDRIYYTSGEPLGDFFASH